MPSKSRNVTKIDHTVWPPPINRRKKRKDSAFHSGRVQVLLWCRLCQTATIIIWHPFNHHLAPVQEGVARRWAPRWAPLQEGWHQGREGCHPLREGCHPLNPGVESRDATPQGVAPLQNLWRGDTPPLKKKVKNIFGKQKRRNRNGIPTSRKKNLTNPAPPKILEEQNSEKKVLFGTKF